MITVDQYVRNILGLLPSLAKDAFDPQVLSAEVGRYISDYYGVTNPNPKYPSNEPKLNYVKGNLFKAATVYKARGNASQFKQAGDTYSFVWGIDLDIIPYARIHEYGGMAGRNLMSKIPARPYITPAIKDFQQEGLPNIIERMLRKLSQAASS